MLPYKTIIIEHVESLYKIRYVDNIAVCRNLYNTRKAISTQEDFFTFMKSNNIRYYRFSIWAKHDWMDTQLEDWTHLNRSEMKQFLFNSRFNKDFDNYLNDSEEFLKD